MKQGRMTRRAAQQRFMGWVSWLAELACLYAALDRIGVECGEPAREQWHALQEHALRDLAVFCADNGTHCRDLPCSQLVFQVLYCWFDFEDACASGDHESIQLTHEMIICALNCIMLRCLYIERSMPGAREAAAAASRGEVAERIALLRALSLDERKELAL